MVAAFRYAANGTQIRRAKEGIQAHLLELRLFADAPRVVLRAQARLLRCTVAYVLHSGPPLLVMLVPMAVLLVQADLRLGWLPIRPGESFVLTGRVADPAVLERVSLRLPPGLTLTAPPVRSAAEKAVSWRIRADRAGEFAAEIALDALASGKQVVVATHLARVSPVRVRADPLQQLLNPGEPAMDRVSPLEAIEVNYRRRRLDFGPVQAEWPVPYFLASLLAALLMKRVLGAEM